MLTRARREGPPPSGSSSLLTRASSPDRERVSHHRHETRLLSIAAAAADWMSAGRSGTGARHACHASGAPLAHGRIVRTAERSRRPHRVTTVSCVFHAHVAASSDALLSAAAIFDVAVRELVNNGARPPPPPRRYRSEGGDFPR